jgi:hypothetical protein
MGRPVDATHAAASYKIDMSHQEMERLLEELEQVGRQCVALRAPLCHSVNDFGPNLCRVYGSDSRFIQQAASTLFLFGMASQPPLTMKR